MSLCLYHGDLDGHTSAAIIDRRFNIDKFVVANYDMDFPFSRIKNDEDVFIVDFSLNSVETFRRLLAITKNVVWIDHHISAIKKFKDFEYVHGLRKDTHPAACRLCWEFCYPLDDLPEFVALASDHDTWSYEFEDDTRNFIAAVGTMEDTSPLNRNWWNRVLGGDQSIVQKLKEDGKKVRHIQMKERRSFVQANSFEIDFKGLKAIVCNKMDGGSLLFEGLDNINSYDIMISFQYCGKNKLWNFSLYSTKDHVQCNEIAKTFGGGGHKSAAGFSCAEIPFELET
jgi:oligoribonuclease NrnB/cAMP/cGMP phosphodiesterase (DHH superfamily)